MPRSPGYDEIADRLDASWDDQAGPEFSGALQQLRLIADGGTLEAAEFLAEILALHGPHHDAAGTLGCSLWSWEATDGLGA